MLAGLSMVTCVSSSRRLLLLRSPELTVRKMALPLAALLSWKVHPEMSPCTQQQPDSGIIDTQPLGRRRARSLPALPQPPARLPHSRDTS